MVVGDDGSKTAKIFGFGECIAIWCVLFVVEMDESVILVLFGKGLECFDNCVWVSMHV